MEKCAFIAFQACIFHIPPPLSLSLLLSFFLSLSLTFFISFISLSASLSLVPSFYLSLSLLSLSFFFISSISLSISPFFYYSLLLSSNSLCLFRFTLLFLSLFRSPSSFLIPFEIQLFLACSTSFLLSAFTVFCIWLSAILYDIE